MASVSVYIWEHLLWIEAQLRVGIQLWMRIVLFLPFLKMGFGGVTVAYQRVRCWAFWAMWGGFCRFGSLNPLCFPLWIMSVSVSLSFPKLMIGWARFSPQSLRSLDPACNSLLMLSWWTKPPIRCTHRPLLTPCCLIQCNWPCHYGCLAVPFPVSACTPTV